MTKPLSTPALRARDLILETLLHRKNLIFTEAVCRDAANNAATALIPLLEDLSRGHAVRGSMEVTSEIGPLNPIREAIREGVRLGAADAGLPGAIPTSEEPPVRPMLCNRHDWCGLEGGHQGICLEPPF